MLGANCVPMVLGDVPVLWGDSERDECEWDGGTKATKAATTIRAAIAGIKRCLIQGCFAGVGAVGPDLAKERLQPVGDAARVGSD